MTGSNDRSASCHPPPMGLGSDYSVHLGHSYYLLPSVERHAIYTEGLSVEVAVTASATSGLCSTSEAQDSAAERSQGDTRTTGSSNRHETSMLLVRKQHCMLNYVPAICSPHQHAQVGGIVPSPKAQGQTSVDVILIVPGTIFSRRDIPLG